MSDYLSPEERSLIDAYDGEVTTCPTGATTDETYVWCPKLNKLVVKTQAATKRNFVFGHGESPAVKARRAKVARLAAEGKTSRQIAEVFGVTQETIRRDARMLGITIELPPQESLLPPEIVARRVRVRALVAQGLSQTEIARRLGVTANRVHSDVKAMGISTHGKGGPKTDTRRRETIRQLFEAGHNQPAIAEKLGVGKCTVWRELKALGLTGSRSKPRRAGAGQ